MSLIDQLLAGTLADPDGGPPLAVPTRSVVIAESLAGGEDELVRGLDLGRRLAVVSDPDTRAAMGGRVERALAAVATVEPVVLPARPHADDVTVARLRRAAASADGLIAVGSGTINDLCKCAAAEDRKPYAVFGTAPSMNGFTSVNAAITVAGHKKSLPARAPVGVFLDLGVLAAAPPRLIRSGLGDSLCRPTAQADWLLAHLLFDRPYRAAPFALLAEDEPGLFAESAALMAGDLTAMARLARTLVLSGFGMTICGGSYPASQGEHLVAHCMEMTASGLPESFHGEQIGVTTLAMARLYEMLLAGGPPRVDATAVDAEMLTDHFGADLGASCWREFAPKVLDAKAAADLNDRLAAQWHDIAERLASILLPARELECVLEAAGAPVTARALGWPVPLFDAALRHAREIRNRYTVLDLAGDCGLLDGFARAAMESEEALARGSA